MAQTYQPGVPSHDAPADGAEPKSSGFYQKGTAVEGGWGFVLPREDGRIEIAPARNAAVIGSDEVADVRIVGPDVAAQHARVEVRADGVYLEDLDSPAGTFVGGVRARRIGVSHGDVVRFGNQLAVFAEHNLADFEGKIDLSAPLVMGPRDIAAFVEPALGHARGGRSFAIEGGPSTGKRALAETAANERSSQGLVVVIDAKNAPAESIASARAQQPATWIFLHAELLPRALQVELGQTLSRTPDVVAIATLETPLDRATSDGLIAPGFGSLFGGRRVTIAPLSSRRETIPGIVWSLARKLGVAASRLSVEFLERIARAGWPGGIAEIEEVLRDAAAQSPGSLDAASIQRPLTRPPSAYPSLPAADDPALARERLVDALAKANGSIASAARTLGMSRQAVYREAQRLGLELGRRRAR